MHNKPKTFVPAVFTAGILLSGCNANNVQRKESVTYRNIHGCRSEVPTFINKSENVIIIESSELRTIPVGESSSMAVNLLGSGKIREISQEKAAILTGVQQSKSRRKYLIAVCSHNARSIKSDADLAEWNRYNIKSIAFFPNYKSLLVDTASLTRSDEINVVPMILSTDFEIEMVVTTAIAVS